VIDWNQIREVEELALQAFTSIASHNNPNAHRLSQLIG
jgi:hypothetical protein